MPIWMIIAEWSARLILVLLVFLSVWSVSIMIDRKRYYQKMSSLVSDFWSVMPVDAKQNPNQIERHFENMVVEKKPQMEKGLAVLGTLGATAPFIGLLGTVLGIIKAFGDLSMNSQNTNQIIFALAEALILTGVGLAVAIPAVVAFNYFQRKNKFLIDQLRIKKNDLLNQG